MTHLSLLFSKLLSQTSLSLTKPINLSIDAQMSSSFAPPTKCHINLVAHGFFSECIMLGVVCRFHNKSTSFCARSSWTKCSIPITCKLQVRLSRRLISPTSMMTQRTQWARFFQRNMKQFSETLSHRRHFCTLQPREGHLFNGVCFRTICPCLVWNHAVGTHLKMLTCVSCARGTSEIPNEID